MFNTPKNMQKLFKRICVTNDLLRLSVQHIKGIDFTRTGKFENTKKYTYILADPTNVVLSYK
jgi:hypothetical protein